MASNGEGALLVEGGVGDLLHHGGRCPPWLVVCSLAHLTSFVSDDAVVEVVDDQGAVSHTLDSISV